MKLKINESQTSEFKRIWRDEYIKYLSAVCHKDHSSKNSIQISVYDDKLIVWNAGDLLPYWTIDTFLGKHTSKPHNPLLVYPFFLAGYIESWGRGIEKIIEESQKFMGETQQNIIKLKRSNQKIAITALASELGISTTAIEKHIKKLKEQNIIQRIGSAKGGHWEILK